MSDARWEALARLLDDWEAKRMTNEFSLDPFLVMKLHTEWLILGPAGLAAARAAKDHPHG